MAMVVARVMRVIVVRAANVIAIAREVIVVMAPMKRAFAQVTPPADGEDRDEPPGLLPLAMRALPASRVIRRADLLEALVAGLAVKLEKSHPSKIVA